MLLRFIAIALLFLLADIASAVILIGRGEVGLPFTMQKSDAWPDPDEDIVHTETFVYEEGIVGNILVYYSLALLLAWRRRRSVAAREERRERFSRQIAED